MKAAFCLPYDLLTVRLGHLPPLGLQMIVCRNLHIRLVLIFEGLKDPKLFIHDLYQCFGSGSGWLRIQIASLDPDPDSDPDPDPAIEIELF